MSLGNFKGSPPFVLSVGARLVGGLAVAISCVAPMSVHGAETIAVKRGGVSVQQATVALYRANPSAFDGSIHRMKPGAVLTVPSAETMEALSKSDAMTELRTGPTGTLAQSIPIEPVMEAAIPMVADKVMVIDQPLESAAMLKVERKTIFEESLEEAVFDWDSFFDLHSDLAANLDMDSGMGLDIHLGMDEASEVARSAELIEARELIARLQAVLGQLDATVLEKTEQLEAIDRQVALLQSSNDTAEPSMKAEQFAMSKNDSDELLPKMVSASSVESAVELSINEALELGAATADVPEVVEGLESEIPDADRISQVLSLLKRHKKLLLAGGLMIFAGSIVAIVYRRRVDRLSYPEEYDDFDETQWHDEDEADLSYSVVDSTVGDVDIDIGADQNDTYSETAFTADTDDVVEEHDAYAAVDGPEQYDDTEAVDDTEFVDESELTQTARLVSDRGENPSPVDLNLFDETENLDENSQRGMELKLVLASAYIDTRFLDEARLLLQEVFEKGTSTQKAQAKEMMQGLNRGHKKRAS